MIPSATHLVLIPSYNPGAKGVETVRAAREFWAPVWVVVDGSDDGTAQQFLGMAASDPHLRVIVRANNGGKGAAVLDGLVAAQAAGYTHMLTMDSDGQHPAPRIPEFMAMSLRAPQAMILGAPV
ncbi:MAG: glycosyltransferase family 2 protein, partial [Gammaproteobacteria bacterium]|nr:glycosyltransferase family 2 protein [Gammaproteobacteria bacterium]